jgi:hypothetical protein
MSADLPTIYSKAFERWGWKCVPVIVACWIVLWPAGVVWLAVSLVALYRARDRSEQAQAERRIARMLSWYPPHWRARYGEEFSEVLRETIRSGQGGRRLTLNVARESNAAWWQSATGRRGLRAVWCWSLCWLPLVTQGLVPLIIKLSGGTARSWFLALYLPAGLQWPVIALMLIAGLVMLAVAVRGTPALRQAG